MLSTVKAQLKDSNVNYNNNNNIAIWILQLILYSALDKVNISLLISMLFSVPCFFWVGVILNKRVGAQLIPLFKTPLEGARKHKTRDRADTLHADTK